MTAPVRRCAPCPRVASSAVARAELAALEEELARAVGLGGRKRRAGSALARYLAATVSDGKFGVFEPR